MRSTHPEGKEARSKRGDKEPSFEKVEVHQRGRRTEFDHDKKTETKETKKEP
jgi:hypothetical protein